MAFRVHRGVPQGHEPEADATAVPATPTSAGGCYRQQRRVHLRRRRELARHLPQEALGDRGQGRSTSTVIAAATTIAIAMAISTHPAPRACPPDEASASVTPSFTS